MNKSIIYSFPKEIQDFIGKNIIKEISIGRSGDSVYEIFGINNYILKISSNIKMLENEKNIYQWLHINNKLPVPEVLCWYKNKFFGYLITKKIRGKMACDNYFLKRPKKLAEFLVEAIEMMSNVDISNFPFCINKDNFVFSHGDLCLPNIIIRNNKIVGFVDMGDAAIRDKEYDVATSLRSYEYNLNSKKYSEYFLNLFKNINKDRVMEYYPIVFG